MRSQALRDGPDELGARSMLPGALQGLYRLSKPTLWSGRQDSWSDPGTQTKYKDAIPKEVHCSSTEFLSHL